MCPLVYVCMYVCLSRCNVPEPHWIYRFGEMRCRCNRTNPPGVKGDMESQKNKMAPTRSQHVCNKNENYTGYHQYGYEVKGLIKTIMKIVRKGGLCIH